MDMQIAKWGNSLALRIPAEIARRLGMREGDTVDAQLTVDGALTIRPASWSRAAFAAELEQAREAMPMGSSVVEELRRGVRY
jgi:antitoxin MazE